MTDASIPVVDGGAALCSNLKDSLDKDGYDVMVCGSGGAAFEACPEKTFDLALVDLSLSALPGIQVIDRLAVGQSGRAGRRDIEQCSRDLDIGRSQAVGRRQIR